MSSLNMKLFFIFLFFNFVTCFPRTDCSFDEIFVEAKNCNNTTSSDDGNRFVCCPLNFVFSMTSVDDTDNVNVCSDHLGFECVSIQECSRRDSNATGLQPQESDNVKLCENEEEICCSKIAKNFKSRRDVEELKGNRCGRHNKNGIETMQGGFIEEDTYTKFGEWPYMCIIYQLLPTSKEGKTTKKFIGGGSLIAPGVILTAAHKVYNKNESQLSVRCGEWDLKQQSEPKPHQDRLVRRITVHPSFYNPLTSNNFGLLHLMQDFQLEAHIDTVCLPSKQGSASADEYNTKSCVAIGWGKDQHGQDGSYQENLKQVRVPIVDREKCQTTLRNTPKISNSFVLDDSLLCAGGEEHQDTCKGDGGGPLVCQAKESQDGMERFIQVGIVSWGVECGNPDVPGVYASVGDGVCFIDWATKCFEGNKYNEFYNIKSCDNWIQDEIDRLKIQQMDLEAKDLDRLTEDQRLKVTFEIETAAEYISNAKALQESCIRE